MEVKLDEVNTPKLQELHMQLTERLQPYRWMPIPQGDRKPVLVRRRRTYPGNAYLRHVAGEVLQLQALGIIPNLRLEQSP